MRKIAAICLGLLALISCEKVKFESSSYDASYNVNGIYENGSLICELNSVFTGGGVADISKGTSHRLALYTENYSNFSQIDKSSIVSIQGFRHVGKTYTEKGEYLESICLRNLGTHEDILVNRDSEYSQSSTSVKKTLIKQYIIEDGNARIDFRIILKDNTTFDVHYVGPAQYDGLM
ncbi:MAG: hypothetical protein KBT08_08105 [Bacteroidales bacterium]|nr:hypothetical protein [Candidatus Cryptobacteroides onthequi]